MMKTRSNLNEKLFESWKHQLLSNDQHLYNGVGLPITAEKNEEITAE